MHDSVTMQIDAPAPAVWRLVSDITRIGEFSPETFEAEWVGGSDGPAVGARFRGHVKRNQRGPTYWSTCEVTECEPDRLFGFVVLVGNQRVNNWRYELDPKGDATAVTESFRLEATLANRVYWSLFGRWRGETNRRGMRATLDRMKTTLEG